MEITEEELAAKINEAIEAAMEKANAAHEAAIKGLKDKNTQLIADKKAAKDAAEEAEAKNAEASGDIDRVKASHEKAIKTLTERAEKAEAARDTFLIDNVITSDLATHNVAPAFRPMLAMAWKAQAKVTDGEAFIGDQPIAEYIKTFATSDEGKHYILAPQTSGGGAVGSTSTTASRAAPSNSAEWAEAMKMANENPAAFNSWMDNIGQPDMKV
ncbi:hypothetical protein GRI62_11850 [Erythrobacter arachoides]|uniref:Uncharacterized protein n=1 Tax=Aurantiacibacter arachoides TaxID=1850444 RepID=A0A845A9N6_9SPHN|nr:hypothetical protein [Aurantiacibacter arachoides]MXO94289.1 hypothetical protein [Aurantiacibacter arachoides]GGD64626.1 hypothetical protein GCM10011411_26190 [Aurantiacibacter arachoides]